MAGGLFSVSEADLGRGLALAEALHAVAAYRERVERLHPENVERLEAIEEIQLELQGKLDELGRDRAGYER